MQKLRGCFNGTGATVTLCLGVIPQSFKLMNVEVATNPETLEWSEPMLKEVLCYGGIYIKGSDGVRTKLTTTGVVPYNGGELMTAANQVTTYGEGTYLTWDRKNYQADRTYGIAGNVAITRWNFVTGLTGYWNVARLASGRIGVGSRIDIKEDSTGLVKHACVTALTSDGEVSAEVTLSRAIGSGTIVFIGGMYDLIPVEIGKTTSPGITLGSETTVNVNDNMLVFEAEADQGING